jgi:DNA-binding transcriptional LysR family regulator
MKKLSMPDESPARHVSVRQLRYFVAVADHRSFRRAAESLAISQPPVTKQVQELERTLGVPLLERSRRKFALTPAGEAFHTEARMMLAGLERACDTIRTLHRPAPRSFVIGMADDFVYGPHFERLLSAAAERGISLDTTVGLSPSLQLQVAHGILDAALLNLPLSGEPSGLVVRPIAPSRIGILAPRNHPLARQSRLRPAALEGVPVVMCSDAPPNAFARQCEKLFVAAGITPTIACRSTSTAIAEMLVERGAGIALVSEHSVRPHDPRLKLVPIESDESLYRHAVAYRADRGSEDLIGLLEELEGEPSRKRKASRKR